MTTLTRSVAPAAPKSGPPQGSPGQVGELIDEVCRRFHDAHRRDLPELVALSRRVEAAHGDHPSAPVGLTDLLQTILGELTKHMAKEEIVVFPRMRANRGAPIDRHLAALIAEHDDHGVRIGELRAIVGDFTPPEDACASWRALYAGLATFVGDLERHIAFENDVLFPLFRGETGTVSSSHQEV